MKDIAVVSPFKRISNIKCIHLNVSQNSKFFDYLYFHFPVSQKKQVSNYLGFTTYAQFAHLNCEREFN